MLYHIICLELELFKLQEMFSAIETFPPHEAINYMISCPKRRSDKGNGNGNVLKTGFVFMYYLFFVLSKFV